MRYHIVNVKWKLSCRLNHEYLQLSGAGSSPSKDSLLAKLRRYIKNLLCRPGLRSISISRSMQPGDVHDILPVWLRERFPWL
jgi:hypothetical protein